MSHTPHQGPQYPQPYDGGFTTPTGGLMAPTPAELSDAATANYLGILGFLGPLIYRAIAGERSAYVKASATAALNFHISIAIYSFGMAIVLGVVVGILVGLAGSVGITFGIGVGFALLLMMLLGLGLSVWSIAASCIGGSRAGRGEIYSYPGSFRFIK